MAGLTTLTVQRKEWLTDHMVRIVLGDPGFDDFTPADATDTYVKIVFAPPGVSYPAGVGLKELREQLPPEQQPVLRTYTVRRYDPQARELFIDFVVHGDEGIAGPWARDVEPGEQVTFAGPGSGYKPDTAAPWHLLASDEAGLPAVAAALEALPSDANAQVFIEVAGPDDEIPLVAPDTAQVTWIHRGVTSDAAPDDRAGDNAPLIAAVRAAPWWDGTPQVFIHGEAQAVMHNLRPYVRKERGVPAAQASISGYWRRGRTEEGFRQWKADLRTAEGE